MKDLKIYLKTRVGSSGKSLSLSCATIAGPQYHPISDNPPVASRGSSLQDADEFLEEYPLGSDPQNENRQSALELKDWLDAYNNSECD